MPLLTHNDMKISERRIAIGRLPEAFEGFRIVQVSDLHFYEHSSPEYYERVVAEVNRLNPDVIACTGDVVHFGGSHVEFAGTFLSRLQAKEAKLAIMGNHDYYDDSGGQAIQTMMRAGGYTFLQNTSHAIERNGQRLWFAGLDDLWYGAPDIAQTLAGVPSRDEVTVMLAHNPLLFDPVALGADEGGWKIDLVLSGHTHAGHVYIPLLGPIYRKIFRMKYRYGLYEKNGCHLHVSSGVGSAAFYLKKQRIGFPRFRFNTWPEIALLELVRF